MAKVQQTQNSSVWMFEMAISQTAGKVYPHFNRMIHCVGKLIYLKSWLFFLNAKKENSVKHLHNGQQKKNDDWTKTKQIKPTCFVNSNAHCRLLKDPFEDSISFYSTQAADASSHSEKKVVTFGFYVFNFRLIPYASANRFNDDDDDNWMKTHWKFKELRNKWTASIQ